MIVSIHVVWEKSCMKYAIVYLLSMGQLESVLVQAVGERLNSEPQTP